MEYSGRTAKEAIEKAKSWLLIMHRDRPDLAGGLFYAHEHLDRHEMRRFSAGYIKGDPRADVNYEDRVRSNCNLIDGYYVIKSDLVITSWRQW